jgi:hypothetical protein
MRLSISDSLSSGERKLAKVAAVGDPTNMAQIFDGSLD